MRCWWCLSFIFSFIYFIFQLQSIGTFWPKLIIKISTTDKHESMTQNDEARGSSAPYLVKSCYWHLSSLHPTLASVSPPSLLHLTLCRGSHSPWRPEQTNTTTWEWVEPEKKKKQVGSFRMWFWKPEQNLNKWSEPERRHWSRQIVSCCLKKNLNPGDLLFCFKLTNPTKSKV